MLLLHINRHTDAHATIDRQETGKTCPENSLHVTGLMLNP